jgi:hypothetical protein
MHEYKRRATRKRRALDRGRVFRRKRFHRLHRFIPLLVQLSFRRKGGLYDKGRYTVKRCDALRPASWDAQGAKTVIGPMKPGVPMRPRCQACGWMKSET